MNGATHEKLYTNDPRLFLRAREGRESSRKEHKGHKAEGYGKMREGTFEKEKFSSWDDKVAFVRDYFANDIKHMPLVIENEHSSIEVHGYDGNNSCSLDYFEKGQHYRCIRPVSLVEAESAVLDFQDGNENWKSRLEWRRIVIEPIKLAKLVAFAVALTILLASIAVGLILKWRGVEL